jgi:rRNA maturation RNase YbeY
MISFNFETETHIQNQEQLCEWVSYAITSEGCNEGEINYVFCNDEYLHKLNVEFLQHDTLTDIISFDYSVGKELHGDVFISIERVKENAQELGVNFYLELHRVMIHGILHYCGYKDKKEKDKTEMRQKEDFYLSRLAQFL